MTYCANTQCSSYGNCNLTFCPFFKSISNKPKQNKYQAQKCEFNGEKFDSLKEMRRWLELRLLERSGEITDLNRQVKFVLIGTQREPDIVGKRGGIIKGKIIEKECAYWADFTYLQNGQLIVEDTKGVRTEVYKIKKKLMLARYGIRIREI